MSSDIVKRGYAPGDEKEFNNENLLLLKTAQQDILYLVNRGYPIKNASVFAGNHYLLSERQRLALIRASAPADILELRRQKRIFGGFEGKCIYIDALNLIITLEVALSQSTLIKCMDGTVRDLAGLRGSYRLIDKTDTAIRMIGEQLTGMKIGRTVFYLDSPVSNTGRLKKRIEESLSGYPFEVAAELVNNADPILEGKDYVVTSDAIILNRCRGWINFAWEIINSRLPDTVLIDLGMESGNASPL